MMFVEIFLFSYSKFNLILAVFEQFVAEIQMSTQEDFSIFQIKNKNLAMVVQFKQATSKIFSVSTSALKKFQVIPSQLAEYKKSIAKNCLSRHCETLFYLKRKTQDVFTQAQNWWLHNNIIIMLLILISHILKSLLCTYMLLKIDRKLKTAFKKQ